MLCCRDRWSVGGKLYSAVMNAHLGFRGCMGGLSGQSSSHCCPPSPTLQAPEVALHFLPTSRASFKMFPLPRMSSSNSSARQTPPRPHSPLINSSLFHEAFVEPARKAYLPPETL